MAYALDLRLPLAAELCRAVREQCAQARACLRRRGTGLPEAVHDARRAVRRARAALLLARPALAPEAYAQALGPWREAGRLLTVLRDAESAIEALQRLQREVPDLLTPAALAHLMRRLRQRRDRLERAANQDLDAAHAALGVAQRAIPGWTAVVDADSLWRGLRRGYVRAARAGRAAAGAAPDAAAWHEFRQRVRAHWLQLELLRLLWPAVLGAHAQEARRLSQLLGHERDLLLLEQRLAALRGELAADCPREPVRARIALLRERLRQRGSALAAVLYSEDGRDFARRVRRYAEAGPPPARTDDED